jgi:hypothetical protein
MNVLGGDGDSLTEIACYNGQDILVYDEKVAYCAWTLLSERAIPKAFGFEAATLRYVRNARHNLDVDPALEAAFGFEAAILRYVRNSRHNLDVHPALEAATLKLLPEPLQLYRATRAGHLWKWMLIVGWG